MNLGYGADGTGRAAGCSCSGRDGPGPAERVGPVPGRERSAELEAGDPCRGRASGRALGSGGGAGCSDSAEGSGVLGQRGPAERGQRPAGPSGGSAP